MITYHRFNAFPYNRILCSEDELNNGDQSSSSLSLFCPLLPRPPPRRIRFNDAFNSAVSEGWHSSLFLTRDASKRPTDQSSFISSPPILSPLFFQSLFLLFIDPYSCFSPILILLFSRSSFLFFTYPHSSFHQPYLSFHSILTFIRLPKSSFHRSAIFTPISPTPHCSFSSIPVHLLHRSSFSPILTPLPIRSLPIFSTDLYFPFRPFCLLTPFSASILTALSTSLSFHFPINRHFSADSSLQRTTFPLPSSTDSVDSSLLVRALAL